MHYHYTKSLEPQLIIFYRFDAEDIAFSLVKSMSFSVNLVHSVTGVSLTSACEIGSGFRLPPVNRLCIVSCYFPQTNYLHSVCLQPLSSACTLLAQSVPAYIYNTALCGLVGRLSDNTFRNLPFKPRGFTGKENNIAAPLWLASLVLSVMLS